MAVMPTSFTADDMAIDNVDAIVAHALHALHRHWHGYAVHISVLINLDFLCWRIDKDAQKQSFLIQTDLLGISAE